MANNSVGDPCLYWNNTSYALLPKNVFLCKYDQTLSTIISNTRHLHLILT